MATHRDRFPKFPNLLDIQHKQTESGGYSFQIFQISTNKRRVGGIQIGDVGPVINDDSGGLRLFSLTSCYPSGPRDEHVRFTTGPARPTESRGDSGQVDGYGGGIISRLSAED
ncbi:hypothetical protein D9757_010791 [Collybiopsis confluens]|uniref:Uncharacterized protein n=1 Tax=Collybiopsis confluens TaxID=2823264 RepID=A0A8H5GTQ3_9AGAR|nr:hypothetical protein D9757_010791 [Collybiopsis confluens]